MPMKNAEPFLIECISSIRKQKYQSWELIIVNDHSTDKSLEMAESLASEDLRIFIYQNINHGIVSALSLAFDKSKGQYISRMDSDDVMPSGRLDQMMGRMLMASNQKTIVTGLVKYFSDEEVSQGYQNYELWLNTINSEGSQWDHVYRECVIASPNWIMKKDDLYRLGGFRNLVYPEDYDLVLKWYAHSFTIEIIPTTTLYWREHPARTSRNSDNYGQRKFFDLKLKAFIAHDLNDGELVLWGTATKGRLAASILDENGVDLFNFHF